MRRLLLCLVLVATLSSIAGCGKQVPDVSGFSKGRAAGLIRSAGLELGAVSYDASATGTLWTVAAQEPGAGDSAKPGSKVALVLAGAAPTKVPSVNDYKLTAAREAIEDAGLVLGRVKRAYDATVGKGLVVEQVPASGELAPKGSRVSVVLSRGPAPIRVPNARGMSDKKAKSLLKKTGFKVRVKKRASRIRKGTVIGQSPRRGKALPGTRVTIIVSSGVRMVSVPDMYEEFGNVSTWDFYDPAFPGDAESWGAGLLHSRGLRSDGEIHIGVYDENSQSPAAGSVVPEGTTVHWDIYITG